MKRLILFILILFVLIIAIVGCKDPLSEYDSDFESSSTSSASSSSLLISSSSSSSSSSSTSISSSSSSSITIVDTDSDGMDDNWEISYFGDLTQDGGSDYDNDGYNNLNEYLGGMDPTAANVTGYTNFIYISGGTYLQDDAWGGSFDHTVSSFSIGQYEVTYELWYYVYYWALSNGYSFDFPGLEGSAGGYGVPSASKYEPVTQISWNHAIVWCNAYSVISGFTACYTNAYGLIITNASENNSNEWFNAACDWSADGYRLPTSGEWQYAASYIDGLTWTPPSNASGAFTYFDDTNDISPLNGIEDGKDACDSVAVYWEFLYGTNRFSTGVTKTAPIGTKLPNQLGLYDMSGNAGEWCWNWFGDNPTNSQFDYLGPDIGTKRIYRGGSWVDGQHSLRIGSRSMLNVFPAQSYVGFRLARSQ